MRTVSVLSVLALLFSMSANAGFLPESPESFVKRLRHVIASRDRAVLLGLYHWERVDKNTREKVEREVDSLLALEVGSVKLMELPPGVSEQIVSNGKMYEMNINPETMIVIEYTDGAGPSSVGLPLGKTPEGYAVGVTIVVGDAPDAGAGSDMPSAKASADTSGAAKASGEQTDSVLAPGLVSQLQLAVTAPAGVVSEIACAYIDTESIQQIVTFKGDGDYARSVDGIHFDTCAAKKRSGTGIVTVILSERGKTIYRESVDATDEPLVYVQR